MGVELDQDRYARGWERAVGGPPPPVTGEFSRVTGGMAFDEIWNRDQLSDREKRLVILTILTLNSAPDLLALHLGSSLRKEELSDDDVEELGILLSVYAGVPRGAAFSMVAARLRAAEGGTAGAGPDGDAATDADDG